MLHGQILVLDTPTSSVSDSSYVSTHLNQLIEFPILLLCQQILGNMENLLEIVEGTDYHQPDIKSNI